VESIFDEPVPDRRKGFPFRVVVTCTRKGFGAFVQNLKDVSPREKSWLPHWRTKQTMTGNNSGPFWVGIFPVALPPPPPPPPPPTPPKPAPVHDYARQQTFERVLRTFFAHPSSSENRMKRVCHRGHHGRAGGGAGVEQRPHSPMVSSERGHGARVALKDLAQSSS